MALNVNVLGGKTCSVSWPFPPPGVSQGSDQYMETRRLANAFSFVCGSCLVKGQYRMSLLFVNMSHGKTESECNLSRAAFFVCEYM